MRFLVIGAGAMGRNHVRVLNALPRVKEVLVVDERKEALDEVSKAGFGKVSTFTSLEEALKQKPDAASIVTPTPSHYDVFRKVNGRVPAVLVEKPISFDSKTGMKIVEEAKRENTVLQIGHVERFNPGVIALKKNIRQLGALRYATVHRFGIPAPRILDDVVIDLAVHDVDVLSFVSGEAARSVFAMERNVLQENTNDLASIVLEFPSFQATVEANRVTTVKVRELLAVGEKGNARLDYISQELLFAHSQVPAEKYSTFDEVVTRVGKGTEVRPFVQKEEPLKLELESFLNAASKGETPLVTGEDGVRAVEVAQAAMQSAKTGKKVQL